MSIHDNIESMEYILNEYESYMTNNNSTNWCRD